MDPKNGWGNYGNRASAKIAKLIGAQEDEVGVAPSLTVGLHFLLAALYKPTE